MADPTVVRHADRVLRVAHGMAPEGVFLQSSTHPRAYGNFVRVLGKYSRDDKLLTLPEALPRVDFEEHKTRYCTLLAIAREYRAHPERFGVVKVWRPKNIGGHAPNPAAAVPTIALGALR